MRRGQKNPGRVRREEAALILQVSGKGGGKQEVSSGTADSARPLLEVQRGCRLRDRRCRCPPIWFDAKLTQIGSLLAAAWAAGRRPPATAELDPG